MLESYLHISENSNSIDFTMFVGDPLTVEFLGLVRENYSTVALIHNSAGRHSFNWRSLACLLLLLAWVEAKRSGLNNLTYKQDLPPVLAVLLRNNGFLLRLQWTVASRYLIVKDADCLSYTRTLRIIAPDCDHRVIRSSTESAPVIHMPFSIDTVNRNYLWHSILSKNRLPTKFAFAFHQIDSLWRHGCGKHLCCFSSAVHIILNPRASF